MKAQEQLSDKVIVLVLRTSGEWQCKRRQGKGKEAGVIVETALRETNLML